MCVLVTFLVTVPKYPTEPTFWRKDLSCGFREAQLPGGAGMWNRVVDQRQGHAGTQLAPHPTLWCSPHSEWVGLLVNNRWKTLTDTPGQVCATPSSE